MDQETKSATDEHQRRCAMCLRSAADGAVLLEQETTVGNSVVYCENPWACELAERDLREHHGLTGAS